MLTGRLERLTLTASLVFTSKGLFIADNNPKNSRCPALSSFLGSKINDSGDICTCQVIAVLCIANASLEVKIKTDECEWRQ
jgi:hypothetical protein